jgi:hypothetical protein
MARIPTVIAAMTLAVSAWAPLAQAQSMAPSSQTEMPPAVSQHPTMRHNMAPPVPRHSPSRSTSSGMAPSGMAQPAPMPMSGTTADGRPMVPVPSQPFSQLNLPNEPAVGDGAYGGGGVVLEYLPDGTRRVVR